MLRFLIIAAICALAAIPAGAQFSFLGLKNELVDFALAQISVPGELEFRAERVEDAEDGALDIVGLTIADGDGVWLSAERLSLAWTPSRILRGELAIDRLSATGVNVTRPPSPAAAALEVRDGAALAQTDDDPFDWPRAPITVLVGELTLTNVDITAGVVADDGIAFSAAGALRDEGDQQAARLSLRRDDQVAGRILLDYVRDFAADTLTLRLDAEEAAGGLVAALAGFPAQSASRAAIDGAGPISDWRLSFSAASDDVFTTEGEARITATDRISAKADFTLTPGAALDPAVRRALSPQAALKIDVAEAEDGLIRIREGALTSRDLGLNAEGAYDRRTGVSDFRVAAEAKSGLSELLNGAAFEAAAFSGALTGPADGLTANGRLSLSGFRTETADIGSAALDAEIVIAGETVRAGITGDASGVRIDRIGPDLIGDARLTASGVFDGATVRIDALTLNARALSLSASGAADLSAETINGRYAVAAADFGPFARAYDLNAGGGARVTGRVSGGFGAPRLEGNAVFTGLRLDGADHGEVEIRHAATFGDAVTGDIDVAAAGGRLGLATLSSGFALDGERLRLSGIAAEALSARLDGELGVDLAGGVANGEIAFRAPDLRPLGRALGAPLSGSARGEVRLTAENGRQNAAFDARADNLSVGGGAVGSATARGKAGDLTGGDPALSATIDVAGADFGGAAITAAAVTLEGRRSALNVSARADGAVGGDALSLRAQAVAEIGDASMRAQINSLTASLGELEAALRAPLTIENSGGVTSFRGIDVAAPGGGATGDATLYGNGAAGALSVNFADLTAVAAATGAPVDNGSFSAEARFDTRKQTAFADVTLTARGLRFADAIAENGDLALDADLKWDGRMATAAAALSGPFGAPLRVRAATPLRPSGGVVPSAPDDGALSGSVDWVGDIGALWALVPAPGHVLDGETRVALELDGTVNAPRVGGDVSIADGRYENLDAGTILVHLDLKSRIAADGGFEIAIGAEDGAGAPVTASVRLADGELDARIGADDAVLVRRDDVTAVLTLDLAAKGPLTGPAITGRILIERAEVRLVNATPPGVADLGPVRVKGETLPEPEPEPGGAVTLAIRVEAPDEIFARGRGLDSEWSMALDVGGTAAAPEIRGQIEKRRGVLSFLGAPLDLTRGAIRFLGRTPPDPRLDILLERENDGVTGGISVTGDASAPEIAFTSRPALAEDEVLPRILFGRSRQSLSPAEAISLAVGLSTLMDGTGGVTDDVRAAVGLDVLRFEQGDDGPALTVGTNIVDGVFVGTTQPIGGGSAKVQVEIEIFDDFTIDSETGPDVGSSIGLNWKRDF